MAFHNNKLENLFSNLNQNVDIIVKYDRYGDKISYYDTDYRSMEWQNHNNYLHAMKNCPCIIQEISREYRNSDEYDKSIISDKIRDIMIHPFLFLISICITEIDNEFHRHSMSVYSLLNYLDINNESDIIKQKHFLDSLINLCERNNSRNISLYSIPEENKIRYLHGLMVKVTEFLVDYFFAKTYPVFNQEHFSLIINGIIDNAKFLYEHTDMKSLEVSLRDNWNKKLARAKREGKELNSNNEKFCFEMTLEEFTVDIFKFAVNQDTYSQYGDWMMDGELSYKILSLSTRPDIQEALTKDFDENNTYKYAWYESYITELICEIVGKFFTENLSLLDSDISADELSELILQEFYSVTQIPSDISDSSSVVSYELMEEFITSFFDFVFIIFGGFCKILIMLSNHVAFEHMSENNKCTLLLETYRILMKISTAYYSFTDCDKYQKLENIL